MIKKLKLSNNTWIELNEQQVEALEALQTWLKVGKNLIFRLAGYAGTGKTTIVKSTIADYMNKHGRWEKPVAVTAPTHKAKKEISKTTGIKGKTIQSLLGLAPNTDVLYFDINKPEFAQLNKPGIEYYSIIIIDEASMLNKDLYEMLKIQSKKFGVKLLLMCDGAQLPPVKETSSPAVTDTTVESYELTKVERQTFDNPLMLVYDSIRNNIDSREDSFKHQTSLIQIPQTEEEYLAEIKPRYMGIDFYSELSQFGSKVVTAFNSGNIKADGNYCKMLCWTNDKVQYWNTAIRAVRQKEYRKSLLETDVSTYLSDIIMPGELLMAYVTTDNGLINASEYTIREMVYQEEILEYGEMPADSIVRPFSVVVNVYDVIMVNVDNPLEEINCMIIEPDTENYKKFLKAFEWYLNQGKFHKKWPLYFGWKANYMLMTDIKAMGGKMICKKDLDYAYAITIHKSQGSTYDEVFLDETDVDKNSNSTERNKLKYVALSRPRYKATVYTTKM